MTIGHLVVGMAASRVVPSSIVRPKAVLLALLITVLAVAPDIDFALRLLGVPASGLLEHRGPTHSITVAMAITAAVGVLAWVLRMPVARVTIAAGIAIGSHAMLDLLTPGPGVQWLWPFVTERLPTIPILPIAPIDHHLFSARGILLVVGEVVVLLPVLLLVRILRRRGWPSAGPQVGGT